MKILNKLLIVIVVVVHLSYSSYSQVTIGDNADPHESAILEIVTEDKGVLFPSMSDDDRKSLKDPVEGLVIYNTDNNEINFFDGTKWFGIPLAEIISESQADGEGDVSGVAIADIDTDPHHSAILEIISPSSPDQKGLLLPKADTVNVANPANGLIIYDTDNNTISYYNGTEWLSLCALLIDDETGTGASPGGVAINTTTPDNSAILHLHSDNKGLLIPRLNNTQRENIPSPADGLIIYNSDNNRIESWFNEKWYEWLVDCPPKGCDGETELDYHGHTYSLVEIGEQCWFAENLNYDNGCSTNTWDQLDDVGWCGCYDDDDDNCEEFGLLYQWSAAMNWDGEGDPPLEGAQGLCPDGWRIPTDDDWKILEKEIGMDESVLDDTGWRGTTQGDEIKAHEDDYPDFCHTGGTCDDEHGFTALPGGHCGNDAINNSPNFLFINTYAYFWSSTIDTEEIDHAYRRYLRNWDKGINRGSQYRYQGKSVRCIK